MEITIFFGLMALVAFFLIFSYFKDSFVLKYFTVGFCLILGITILVSPLSYQSGSNITLSGSTYQVVNIYTNLNLQVSNFYGMMCILLGFAVLAMTIFEIINERKDEGESYI